MTPVQTVKDVTDGAMLGGKYRIRRVLGQGGMGVVVEAVHVELDDRVAIKFLTPRASAEPDAVQRFVREAKAAVRLRSEHIARVRDVGLLPGGDPYIVMEYLDGVELRQLFSGPRLAPSALVDLVLQACEGLAEAHSHGIVHRDIKPSNLFVVTQVDGAPHVKVLDFGVSKVPLDDLNLTGTNSWMGTPAYMSPEQMRSTKNVDARSDLWSLAVVLYEGLEGRVPFPGDSLADLCINVTSMPPQPLTDRTPAALAPIVMKGLAKRPDDRFETAAAFAAALAPFAETSSHAEMIVRRTRRLMDRRATPPQGAAVVERPSGALRAVPSAATEHLERPVAAKTEHLNGFVAPSPSSKLRAEVDADLAAAFDVMKVDSAALANPPDAVAAARAGGDVKPAGHVRPAVSSRGEIKTGATRSAGGGNVDEIQPTGSGDIGEIKPAGSGDIGEIKPVGRSAISSRGAAAASVSENDIAVGELGFDAGRSPDPTPSMSGDLGEVVVAGRRSTLGILAGLAAVVVVAAIVLFAMRGGAERPSRDAGSATSGAAPDTSMVGTTPPNANGTTPNGATPNGTTPNGTTPNGATPNGTTPNGTTPNGTTADSSMSVGATVGANRDGANRDATGANRDANRDATGANRDATGANRDATGVNRDTTTDASKRPQRHRPDTRVPTPGVPIDAGVTAPADAATSPAPSDAAPTSTPDADPLGRRT